MTTRLLFGLAACAILIGTCRAPDTHAAVLSVPQVTARAQTQPIEDGQANAAVWVRAGTASPGLIVAATALGGLQIYRPDGTRLSSTPSGEVTALAVAEGVTVGGWTGPVIAALDLTSSSLRLFALRGERLDEVGSRPFPLGFAAEGACFFNNPLDESLHVFVVGDGGEIDQQIVFAAPNGSLDLRPVRRIQVPSPLKQCAADAGGYVYASEESVGVWRFNADPEADVAARLVDAPRLGHIREESGGVALFKAPGRHWLLAADTSAGQINVYDRDREDAFVGAFSIASPGKDGGPVEEPGALFAASAPGDATFADGMLLVTDEDAGNFKLLRLDDVASALGLAAIKPLATPTAAPRPAAVRALVETVPAGSYGDAADDPAIWPDLVDPSRSLVVATDKKAGLYLYDMAGKVVQFLADGKMNNVDLREGFMLGGRPVVLVTASNRTQKSIAIYRLDPVSRRLVDVADGPQPTGMDDPYGLCMYRSPKDGRDYVFVNGDDTLKRQWELLDAGNGKVRTRKVRDLSFDSQTEGCVADDQSGQLYVDEEDVAIWRLSAEPSGGNVKTAVDLVEDNFSVKADLEGVGMYDLGDGRGYLIVSSQGNDSYAVYRREGKQEYLGSFVVVADPVRGIDGISETDGLEVTSRNLGPGFEQGAMIAQDGRNVMPVENQNYKMVPWSAIAAALKLEVRSTP